jgi:hypothetical protein
MGLGAGAGVENRGSFHCDPSMGESLERSLENCIGRREVSEAWTQTLSESGNSPKESVLEALKEITRRQQQMKSKIGRYKHFELLL